MANYAEEQVMPSYATVNVGYGNAQTERHAPYEVANERLDQIISCLARTAGELSARVDPILDPNDPGDERAVNVIDEPKRLQPALIVRRLEAQADAINELDNLLNGLLRRLAI
jgi:hypothetical protein